MNNDNVIEGKFHDDGTEARKFIDELEALVEKAKKAKVDPWVIVFHLGYHHGWEAMINDLDPEEMTRNMMNPDWYPFHVEEHLKIYQKLAEQYPVAK